MNRGLSLPALAALALVAAPRGQAYDDWMRNLRVGAWIAFGVNADFSLSGSVPVSGVNPGATGVHGVDHVYDNGFVRVDQTRNAQGYTSNWGYQDASQLSGSDLVYRATRSFTTADFERKEGGPQVGLDVAYGWTLGFWGSTRIGVEFGFGLLPIDLSDSRTLTGSLHRTVHSFDTGGILLPQAPYSGGASGVGPVIRDVATALPDETVAGEVRGSRVIDAWLYDLRLGPQLYRELGGRWAVSGGAGGTLGIVAGEYRFNERVVVEGIPGASNTGGIGRTAVNWGAYANAMLLFHTNPEADFYIGVQWMTLGETRFGDGNREGRLRMGSSLQVITGISWPF